MNQDSGPGAAAKGGKSGLSDSGICTWPMAEQKCGGGRRRGAGGGKQDEGD